MNIHRLQWHSNRHTKEKKTTSEFTRLVRGIFYRIKSDQFQWKDPPRTRNFFLSRGGKHCSRPTREDGTVHLSAFLSLSLSLSLSLFLPQRLILSTARLIQARTPLFQQHNNVVLQPAERIDRVQCTAHSSPTLLNRINVDTSLPKVISDLKHSPLIWFQSISSISAQFWTRFDLIEGFKVP